MDVGETNDFRNVFRIPSLSTSRLGSGRSLKILRRKYGTQFAYSDFRVHRVAGDIIEVSDGSESAGRLPSTSSFRCRNSLDRAMSHKT